VRPLLAAAPHLLILATSRRPLHFQGEREMPVLPLGVPGGGEVEEVAACGAARLFVQLAHMARPGFALSVGNAADIAAICRRLDGLPLAIELVASRVRLLAPRALLARLGHGLGLAVADTGRPSRQQTLRAAIGWSYDLLGPELAGVFRRAGVFAGGCDLDALTAVAMAEDDEADEPDPLQLAAGLLDVSLITVTEGAGGEPRVGLLERSASMLSSAWNRPASLMRPAAGTPRTTPGSRSENMRRCSAQRSWPPRTGLKPSMTTCAPR